MNLEFPADTTCSHIKDYVVETRCGLHPWEKHPERPNRLIINVWLYAPLKSGPMEPQSFVDYDVVADFLKTFPARPHTNKLETLVDGIMKVGFSIAAVTHCRVSVMKPDIFNNAAGAGIDVVRTRKSWAGL